MILGHVIEVTSTIYVSKAFIFVISYCVLGLCSTLVNWACCECTTHRGPWLTMCTVMVKKTTVKIFSDILPLCFVIYQVRGTGETCCSLRSSCCHYQTRLDNHPAYCNKKILVIIDWMCTPPQPPPDYLEGLLQKNCLHYSVGDFSETKKRSENRRKGRRLLLGDADNGCSGGSTSIKLSTGLDSNTEQLQTLQRQCGPARNQRRDHEDSVHHLTRCSDLCPACLLHRSVSVPHFHCLVCLCHYIC